MSNLPPNRHPFDVQALLLRVYPYGEGDQIVALFTREHGMLRAMAKGARRPKSRLGGLIAPLRCLQLELVRNRNLHRISQAVSQRNLGGLQQDYDRLTIGLAMGEVVSQFCQEEDAQPELYDGLLKTLTTLSQSERPRDVLLWFLIHFLAHQGYWTSATRCHVCERRFNGDESRYFDIREGGLCCGDCREGTETRFVTTTQADILVQLRRLSDPGGVTAAAAEGEEGASVLTLIDPADTTVLLRHLQHFLQYLAGQELRCFAFLQPIELPNRTPTR